MTYPVEYFRWIDPNSSRINLPEELVFFCGGRRRSQSQNTAEENIPSFRDKLEQLWRNEQGVLEVAGCRAILAEDINALIQDSPYSDLLEFEADISAISACVLLLSESPGSFAELGAFAIISEIAQNLVVVFDDQFLDPPSFIADGPIRRIRTANRSQVCYVRWHIRDQKNNLIVKPELMNALAPQITEAVRNHIDSQPGSRVFSAKVMGRCILLVCGIVHLLGAAKRIGKHGTEL